MSDNIKKLTPYQHVRLRTTVYYGSTIPHTGSVLEYDNGRILIKELTWVPAAYTMFREILDNALDEVVVHGHGNKIIINYNPNDFSFEVQDNGNGIPIIWDEDHKMHKATLALSELMAGRNFEDRQNTAGLNGIGAAGVNFCSEYFNVEITRDDKKFVQTFKEGDIIDDRLQISKPKITDKKGQSGTKIVFKLSSKVLNTIILPEEYVRNRIIEIASANPNVKFIYNGNVVKTNGNLNKTLFSQHETVPISIINEDRTFNSKFWLIPNTVAEGDHSHSLVNNISMMNGGAHLDSFKRYFVSGLISALERESNRRKLSPNRSDICEGLLIYNITTMARPEFDSQSKTRLISDTVDKTIKDFFDNELIFKTIIRQNKEWIDSIYERCAARTLQRDASDVAKASRKLLRNKLPKLLDANSRDRSKCILLLTEGDSAKTTLAAVRDPEIHGALPLRGKILNVRGEPLRSIIDNQIIGDLMNSIGLILGQKTDRIELRYGKVYLATDQDPDGFNIMALLVNFFYLHWPELFDPKLPPFFYAFQTPFIIQEKGKKRHYWYADDYMKYNPDDWKGCPKATRAKGLGSLEEVDWTYSLQSPKLIPLIDDGNLSEALDLIFRSERADDRKLWISI